MVTTRQKLVEQSGGEQALTQNLVGAQIAPSNFEKYIRAIIITDKLAAALEASGITKDAVDARISELITGKAKELKVTINPRYGTWDFAAGDIVATDSAGDAISTPAPTK
jgi:hypothetical protein